MLLTDLALSYSLSQKQLIWLVPDHLAKTTHKYMRNAKDTVAEEEATWFKLDNY